MNESPEKVESLLLVLPSIWTSIDLSSQAGPAFLNLLTTIGCDIPEAPYILESLIEDLENYPTSFRLQLLNSTVTLFLHRPAECRGILSKLFKSSINPTETLDVRERALFLYLLLQHDIEKVCQFIINGFNRFTTSFGYLIYLNLLLIRLG